MTRSWTESGSLMESSPDEPAQVLLGMCFNPPVMVAIELQAVFEEAWHPRRRVGLDGRVQSCESDGMFERDVLFALQAEPVRGRDVWEPDRRSIREERSKDCFVQEEFEPWRQGAPAAGERQQHPSDDLRLLEFSLNVAVKRQRSVKGDVQVFQSGVPGDDGAR